MPNLMLSRRCRAALLDLGDQISAAKTIDTVSQIVSEFLGRALVASRAGYAVLDLANDRYEVQRDWVRSGIESIVGRHSLEGFTATIDRLRRREPIVVDDISRERSLEPDWAGYQAIAVKAMIVIPLLDQGELVGALFAHADSPRSWTRDEIDLARSVADRTYAAIAKITTEEEQKTLNQELVHSLKNALAMIQSIASQTLKKSADPEAFNAFSNRLVALGMVHEILIGKRISDKDIGFVISYIMNLHCSRDRYSVDGPNLALGPRAALSLSMILHELATNALKYGALSQETGRLSIQSHLEGKGDQANLVLTWKESGGPAVTEPVRTGFGSRLIKTGLIGTGQVERRYLPAGIEVEFRAPVARLRQW